jgi:putative nucleotidyltransferase with HDIG domain
MRCILAAAARIENLGNENRDSVDALTVLWLNMVSFHPSIPPSLQKVPQFPPIAAKLLTLVSSPSVDLKEVAHLISGDPVLTARVLHCVNSIEFGLLQPVSDLQQSVMLLGLDRTRQITVAGATAAYARRLATAEALRSWHHSLATAVLAEYIAHSCRAFLNLAFVAGIMHDIGRLALLVAFPVEYERVIRLAKEDDSLDLLALEEREFGVDHAEAGRLLVESWGLPEEFRLVAGRHHDSCDGSEIDLLRIVNAACGLAQSLGFGVLKAGIQSDVSTLLNRLPPPARKLLEKSPAELCAQIEERISGLT